MGVRDLLRNRGKQIDTAVSGVVPRPLSRVTAGASGGAGTGAGGYAPGTAPWIRKKAVKKKPPLRDMMGRVIK